VETIDSKFDRLTLNEENVEDVEDEDVEVDVE